jgi:hypothetical protein
MSAWSDQRADPGAGRLSHVRRLEALGLRRHQPARPEGVRFWTKTKTITQRWPDGSTTGENAFVIPTMG